MTQHFTPAVVQSGRQLDHYRLESVVARSGMASIFRGTDLRTGLRVALKIPHPELECDSVFLKRFQREEEIGQRLDHPGIVKVLANPNRTGTYMVMEWAEGRLLRQMLSGQARLSQGRAIRLTVSICDALEYIHRCGVVHRDLKPENIMVDDEDRIKLIDFGIASAEGARRLTITSLAQVVGTPHYISPEQVDGGSGDARSDLYALGVILYEMLTGKTPFMGKNSLAIMTDRLHHNPVPPVEIDSKISGQLQEVIYRALERAPANRYQGAREFAWDLEHLDKVGVTERAELRDWEWRKRPLYKRVLFCAGMGLIPVVVFGTLLYIAQHV